MVRLHEALRLGGFETELLLQVHDELVLEVPHAELEAVRDLCGRIMTSAGMPAVDFQVPITVDFGSGATWDEAH